MKTLLIVLAALLLIECSTEQKQLEGQESECFATEVILADSVSTLLIPVKIIYYASGCDTFKSMEVKETENQQIEITFFTHNPVYHNPDFACPTSFFKRETDQIITVPAKGNYTLLFNQGKLIKKIKVQ